MPLLDLSVCFINFVVDCSLDWPQYHSVSREEEELPLAYAITAFSDARNIELTLATIFR